MKRYLSFTSGGIYRPLVFFTLPILFAICLQAMYGAVDLAVVGWFSDASAVSAVSTGSQIMQTVTMVITGLSMGTTILLGQSLGAGKSEKSGDIMGGSIFLFSVIAVLMTVVMLISAGPFVSLMQAPEEAYSYTVEYVVYCSAGSVFIVAYNLLGGIFRGLGDSKTPLMAVLIACVCNIVADIIFVGALGLSARGAALATVISQAISVTICILVIRHRKTTFSFSVKSIRYNRDVIKKVLKIGFPVALEDALVSVSFLAILAIVNSLGLVASAAIGVAEKICAFIMLIPSAFMQSLSAFVAHNIGAGKQKRADRALVYGMLTSFAFGLVVAYFAFFHGVTLADIFSGRDSEISAAAADYLRAYAIDTVLVSFLFCFMGYFNGCSKTAFVMIQGITGAFAVRIPVSFFMSRIMPVSLFRVGLATPCSTIVQIIICTSYFICLHRKNAKSDVSIPINAE